MRCLQRRTLEEVTGTTGQGRSVSDLAYAVIDNQYPEAVLSSMAREATALWDDRSHTQEDKYLQLDHLRGVQSQIDEVAALMTAPERLATLSEIAGVELEPYPIPPASAHVNHYVPGKAPIEFHTDGTALVELVPLHMSCPNSEGTTMIYRGDAAEGKTRLGRGESFGPDELVDLEQAVGRSVLMQGRMLLHGVRPLQTGSRTTLVLALRSAAEPWKDGNTLARLLLDDDLDEVEQPWVDDQVHISNLYRQQAGIAAAAAS